MAPGAVSLILPTLNEARALEQLREPLLASLAPYDSEVIIVDDGSSDGTIPLIESWGRQGPFRLLVRRGQRGLASAVLDGVALARGDVIVVMDADGSHAAESIPGLIDPVIEGRAEFVLGSRRARGGSSPGLGRSRKLVSAGAAVLARPLTRVRDPMSGFFAVERSVLRRADLRPIGYKIGLEILVRCRPAPILEMPICFGPRIAGESKLWNGQIGGYLHHLSRLYRWRVGPGRRLKAGVRSTS